MNIKSELIDKSEKFFPNFSFNKIILIPIVMAFFLSLLIIAFGDALFIKILFLIITISILLISVYDNASILDDEKPIKLKQGLLMIIIVLVLLEIPLYITSKRITKIDLYPIISDISISNNKDDNYKLVEFYNTTNNDRESSVKVYKHIDKSLKLFKNIIGKEYYIDYFPFLVYSEEFRYIRKPKNSITRKFDDAG